MNDRAAQRPMGTKDEETIDLRPRSFAHAHDLASGLIAAELLDGAKLVLQAAIEASVPGDKADVHNAHTVALDIDEHELALAIADVGLDRFADDHDLVADRARALASLGRPRDAIAALEEFAERRPDQFARGWRPIVFYADAVKSGGFLEDDVRRLEMTFARVSTAIPYEHRVWSAYGRFLLDIGRYSDAEKVYEEGLRYCPLSQVLNYELGESLLLRGRVEESTAHLEQALRVDYQDQYQHDINQGAIRATLAQAYEANGKLRQARTLYQGLVKGDSDTISRYATNRLTAIDALLSVQDVGASSEEVGQLAAQSGQPANEDITQLISDVRRLVAALETGLSAGRPTEAGGKILDIQEFQPKIRYSKGSK